MSEAAVPCVPDYDAIEATLRETTHGRHFLAEFARRNADSQDVAAVAVKALAGELEKGHPAPAPAAAGEALASLEANVETTAAAFAAILVSTARLRALVRAGRAEGNFDDSINDALDMIATDIDTACKLREAIGERNRAAVDLIRAVESRLAVMRQVCEALPPSLKPAPPAIVPSAVVHSLAEARRMRPPANDSHGESSPLKHLSYEETVALFT